MWPGASPAWRKRTKPRLGINLKPPSTSAGSFAVPSGSTDPIFNAVDPLLFTKRQLDDGTDAGDDGGGVDASDDGAAAATTFNNGMWTPAAAATVQPATPTGFTATVPLAASTDASDTPDATSAPSPTMLVASSTVLSSTPTPASSSSPLSHTASSSSSTSSTSTAPLPSASKASSSSGGGGGFKLIYLTPVFVFVGLLLLFSIGGRIWGRIHHASRVEAARRARYDKRVSRQAKKQEMQRIKTMWGYDRTPVLPPELEPGEHDLHYKNPNSASSKLGSGVDDAESSFGSSSDAGEREDEEKYPGTFKILSLALLGEGSRPQPPETRGEGGRKYEAGVQSNSWFAVKLRRWIGRDEQDESVEQGKYTLGPQRNATSRRERHALGRDRMRGGVVAGEDEEDEKERLTASSPATTLSVGSGELKYKAEFSMVDLNPSYPANAEDDPFVSSRAEGVMGMRKPLPPQPKESPFRPAILNFGLRSRSKTYDPVALTTAGEEADTPVKRTAGYRYAALPDDGHSPAGGGFLGLGISGVWKAVTNFGAGSPAVPASTVQNANEDGESFLAHPPYRAGSPPLMSENDTPYSNPRPSHMYSVEATTPTKLGRTGTVLHVKPNTNQPWNVQQKKMTAAAWNEALLASPPNKHAAQHNVYQPLPMQPSRSPTKSLAPRKSLLLHQAIVNPKRTEGDELDASPALTADYSDLMACYSAPSEAVMSPQSIRAVPPPKPANVEDGGARAKLQRAKTAKLPTTTTTVQGTNAVRANGGASGVQRSKTASTATTSQAGSGGGLSRKATTRAGIVKTSHADHAHDETEQPEEADITSARGASASEANKLYPYHLTQPLRLAPKSNPSPSLPVVPMTALAIPTRASSSPTKPSASTFPPSFAGSGGVPPSLRIASPPPFNPHPSHHPLSLAHPDFASFPHPHYQDPASASSPPKRSKAVSNRSTDEDTIARGAVVKAKNRSTALQEVDQIVFQSYSQHPHNQHQQR